MGLIVSSMLATKPKPTKVFRVTATGPSTHVVEVNFISKLQQKYRRRRDEGYINSPTFAIAGLDWNINLCFDEDGDAMRVFVELATAGAVAWARVKIGLVDWTTGRADTLCPREGDAYAGDPVLFDAGGDHCFNWGTYKLASWENELRRSRYLRRDDDDDCLQIECVVDVCHAHLAFPDPPVRRRTPPHVEVAGELGSPENADVFIHDGGGDGEPIPAHSSVLDAYARGFLKAHNLGKRRRRPNSPPASAAAAAVMRVDVDGMPRHAVEVLLLFVYTGTLPVVDGMSGDGYRDMFWDLLLAADRYGMRRLSAICRRVLCNCIDIETVAATMAAAHRHGYQEIKKVCLEFASDPEKYALVQRSKGYGELMCLETFSLVRELWAMYCDKEQALSTTAD